jgi:hypothetical protein
MLIGGCMVTITMTQEEAAMLTNVLGTYVSDLRMEVADTEKLELRENLKKQEAFLNKLLTTLETEGTYQVA